MSRGVFVILCGVELLLFAITMTLCQVYYIPLLFGKCQQRTWRILLCFRFIMVFVLIIFLMGLTFFSGYIGSISYPLVSSVATVIDERCRTQFYSALVFGVALNALGCVTVLLFVISGIPYACYIVYRATVHNEP